MNGYYGKFSWSEKHRTSCNSCLHKTDTSSCDVVTWLFSSDAPRGRGYSLNGSYGEALPERGNFFTFCFFIPLLQSPPVYAVVYKPSQNPLQSYGSGLKNNKNLNPNRYSLQWPIRRRPTRKGLLFQASAILKGREVSDFGT